MVSPSWLPEELQSSTSQASVSGPPTGGASVGPLTPTAAPPAPPALVGTPTSNGLYSIASDSKQEAGIAKFVTSPVYAGPTPSFLYNMLPNVYTTSGSSEQSSSSPPTKSNSPSSSAFIQPTVPGISASAAPSFSYNISHVGVGFPSGQQIQSRMPTPGHSQGGKNTPSPAASLQPPVPGQLARPSFLPGALAQIMPPLVPSPVGFPKAGTSNSANFSSGGNYQSMQKDQSIKSPAHTTSSSASSDPNLGPTTFWIPTVPSFQVHPGVSRTPVTPGALGLAPSVPLLSNMTVSSPFVNSSSARLGPMAPTTHVPSNPAVQKQTFPPYPSVPPMLAPPQGLWLQAPQISGLPRPPLLPRPAALPGPFLSSTHGVQLPSVPLPDSQPPGVTHVGAPSGTSMSSAASGNQLVISSGMEPELPPGIDNNKHVNDVIIKDRAPVSEQLDAWTAHRTETGAVYYYNAFTGESTYEKPSAFQGELEKVAVQPTPVSWERLASTDWALVTTNDGKRYYYNTKTKLSSWQIPTEVTELRKKQDVAALREQSMSVPNSNILTEKGSAPISLSAPAVNTGGRDATALRTLGVPGLSSALDLIKRKLQDSVAPVTSSPVSSLSGTVVSELNGSRAVEAAVNGAKSENSKDKQKDANGDGNMSDSSSDSEDVDSGPTKEECIIQFKEMLKERQVAPFSKWEKELPKIVFDPRFKAIPGYSSRRSLFEHYVRTRAEEERKEKRVAQKAAIESFRQLLEEAKEDIDHNTDYLSFKKKWGHDPRVEALDRKEREVLLNERVLPLKKVAQEKAQAMHAAAASNFKSMLKGKGDITTSSRWSKVKDSLRNDPRYKSVKHDDREALFNKYISELRSTEEEAERVVMAKRDEEKKLKERERAFHKRKEREEQEVERVRSKARKKEAVESYQALLVETIKDPQASWMESNPKLEKDPQGRGTSHYLYQSDLEKLFREHVKMLHERCAHEFRALLAEVITADAALQENEGGKTVFTSWSTAKRLLKSDPRYTKMPRKERESLWRRHVEEMQRRQKLALNQKAEKRTIDAKGHTTVDSGKYPSGSRRTQ